VTGRFIKKKRSAISDGKRRMNHLLLFPITEEKRSVRGAGPLKFRPRRRSKGKTPPAHAWPSSGTGRLIRSQRGAAH
jgi:hypothetical protein